MTAPADPREALTVDLLQRAWQMGYDKAARDGRSGNMVDASSQFRANYRAPDLEELASLVKPTLAARQDEPSPALRGRLLSALDDVPTHRQKIEIGDDGRPAKIGPKIARHPAFVRADCVAAVENVLAVRPQPMLTELEP